MFKEIKELVERITNLKVVDSDFDRAHFVENLKKNVYKKVAILTGAGISVAAGIPDFRSPGIGLYAQLQKFNLPYPEAIFELGFFKQQPMAFYQLANNFVDTLNAKPVKAHRFIRQFQENGSLLLNFTQNIDGLELDAGLKKEKLVQAHGHMRAAHCIECKAEQSVQKLIEGIKKLEVFKCESCKNGLVKPDIIFFGEQLPTEFFNNWKKIQEADLIIIMGTSLKVMPFAMLPSLVKDNVYNFPPGQVPIVVINREHVMEGRKNTLFLQGDIEATVESLSKDLGWKL